jgi:hypothetical protein
MRRITRTPLTVEDHVNSVTGRIEKLERERQLMGLHVYVQPDEPLGVPVGTLWFDTDEPV